MLRTLLTIILPLITPTILYFMWVGIGLRKNNQPTDGDEETSENNISQIIQRSPWVKLFIAGGICVIIALIGSNLQNTPSPKDSIYIPAQWKDGKVIPGRTVPKDQITPQSSEPQ